MTSTGRALRSRLARLEAAMGVATSSLERPPGFVVIYAAGTEPALISQQRAAIARGAAVFYMPDNGRRAALGAAQ